MMNPEYRLPQIRIVDVILAVLQATFAHPELMGVDNAYLFSRDDPVNSRVWICDPDSRVDGVERDGQRMIITVYRAEYGPSDANLNTIAESDWEGNRAMSDLGEAQLYIDCEAGNKLSSEALAGLVYYTLRAFRRQNMVEYDINRLQTIGIAPPVKRGDAPGSPWTTTVSIRIWVQEHYELSEAANQLNHVAITTALAAGPRAPQIVSLDG